MALFIYYYFWSDLQDLEQLQKMNLGERQKLQVYANILVKDLVWKDGKLMLNVQAKKFLQLHGTLLPFPWQLHTMIEFFKQHIQPHLLSSSEDNRLLGGALKPLHFSHNVLPSNCTILSFISALLTWGAIHWLGSLPVCISADEPLDKFYQRHTQLLNMFQAVMDTHYNNLCNN